MIQGRAHTYSAATAPKWTPRNCKANSSERKVTNLPDQQQNRNEQTFTITFGRHQKSKLADSESQHIAKPKKFPISDATGGKSNSASASTAVRTAPILKRQMFY
jgi:hypothetical protein